MERSVLHEKYCASESRLVHGGQEEILLACILLNFIDSRHKSGWEKMCKAAAWNYKNYKQVTHSNEIAIRDILP